MNILNFLTGTINFNKIADDYERNDRSYAASYAKHHVKGPTNLFIALTMLIITVGVIIGAVSSVWSNNKTDNKPRDGKRNRPDFRGNRNNNKVPLRA